MNGKIQSALLIVAALACAGSATAAKSYQVTGPVLEVTDKTIVVEKDKEKWELDKDATTKVTGGELKVGEKVTIHYTMTCKDIEVKPEKPAAAPAAAKATVEPKKAAGTPATTAKK